jgi:hypothetical protein
MANMAEREEREDKNTSRGGREKFETNERGGLIKIVL